MQKSRQGEHVCMCTHLQFADRIKPSTTKSETGTQSVSTSAMLMDGNKKRATSNTKTPAHVLDTTLTVDVDHTCDFVVRPNKLLSGPRLKGWHNQLNGESAINNEVHRRAEKIRGSIS